MKYSAALNRFVERFTCLIDCGGVHERDILSNGSQLLANLISRDNWLPQHCAAPDPRRYQQYLLHCDPLERFSVVSFVWAPGQATPIHDHTVWGLIGVLIGAERSERFALDLPGQPMRRLQDEVTSRGSIEQVSPSVGDIHRVSNASSDTVSISIHVYGGNIGKIRRHTYDPVNGMAKQFVSAYSNHT